MYKLGNIIIQDIHNNDSVMLRPGVTADGYNIFPKQTYTVVSYTAEITVNNILVKGLIDNSSSEPVIFKITLNDIYILFNCEPSTVFQSYMWKTINIFLQDCYKDIIPYNIRNYNVGSLYGVTEMPFEKTILDLKIGKSYFIISFL